MKQKRILIALIALIAIAAILIFTEKGLPIIFTDSFDNQIPVFSITTTQGALISLLSAIWIMLLLFTQKHIVKQYQNELYLFKTQLRTKSSYIMAAGSIIGIVMGFLSLIEESTPGLLTLTVGSLLLGCIGIFFAIMSIRKNKLKEVFLLAILFSLTLSITSSMISVINLSSFDKPIAFSYMTMSLFIISTFSLIAFIASFYVGKYLKIYFLKYKRQILIGVVLAAIYALVNSILILIYNPESILIMAPYNTWKKVIINSITIVMVYQLIFWIFRLRSYLEGRGVAKKVFNINLILSSTIGLGFGILYILGYGFISIMHISIISGLCFGIYCGIMNKKELTQMAIIMMPLFYLNFRFVFGLASATFSGSFHQIVLALGFGIFESLGYLISFIVVYYLTIKLKKLKK